MKRPLPTYFRKRSDGKISIGRNTVFGNPIKVNKICPICNKKHGQAETQKCYKKYLFAKLKSQKWAIDIAKTQGVFEPELSGGAFFKLLIGLKYYDFHCPGCTDKNKRGCHGEILRSASNWAYENRLNKRYQNGDFSK